MRGGAAAEAGRREPGVGPRGRAGCARRGSAARRRDRRPSRGVVPRAAAKSARSAAVRPDRGGARGRARPRQERRDTPRSARSRPLGRRRGGHRVRAPPAQAGTTGPAAPRLGGVEQLPRRGEGGGSAAGGAGGSASPGSAVEVRGLGRLEIDRPRSTPGPGPRRRAASLSLVSPLTGVAARWCRRCRGPAEHRRELDDPALAIEPLDLGDGPPVALALRDPEVGVRMGGDLGQVRDDEHLVVPRERPQAPPDRVGRPPADSRRRPRRTPASACRRRRRGPA